jgi:hypothetical protein
MPEDVEAEDFAVGVKDSLSVWRKPREVNMALDPRSCTVVPGRAFWHIDVRFRVLKSVCTTRFRLISSCRFRPLFTKFCKSVSRCEIRAVSGVSRGVKGNVFSPSADDMVLQLGVFREYLRKVVCVTERNLTE